MQAVDARRRWLAPLVMAVLCLGACTHDHHRSDADGGEAENVYPANYKSDILAAMHAFLNDPTGIRDAGVSEPLLKSEGSITKRYMACVRFNAKSGGGYAGVKEIAAVFVSGRFDRFIEAAHDQCADASYAPFPELGKLPR